MDEQTKHQALLHRLLCLADKPQEQIRYVLELLEKVPSSIVDDLFTHYISYSVDAMKLVYETKEDEEKVVD